MKSPRWLARAWERKRKDKENEERFFSDSDFPELEGAEVVAAFVGFLVGAALQAERTCHLLDGLILVLLHPGFQAGEEFADTGRALREEFGHDLHGVGTREK